MRSVVTAAARVRRELERQARPAGSFDPSRYFRTTERLAFLNVPTPIVRALGREIAREHRDRWTIDDALAFAGLLVRDPRLEVKGAGIEALAVRRRELGPGSLRTFKRWLAGNLSANWATTDSMCGSLISPVLAAHPGLVPDVAGWTRHRNMWVRRAAAVSMVRLAARGRSLDEAYGVARSLMGDREDLIQKACGWLLREAGKTDPGRLERYLRAHGPDMPRTTVRYAIERFAPAKRAVLLASTRGPAGRRDRRAVKS